MTKNYIDKLAYIYIKNKKILVTLSKGKNTWYIPGGKREEGESDEQALVREVSEELSIELITTTISYFGTFEAQAHGKSKGIIVRMTCYMADFKGEIKPAAEIDQIDFFQFSQKSQASPVDHLIFDDLKAKNLIK